jgi:hypothetical protein
MVPRYWAPLGKGIPLRTSTNARRTRGVRSARSTRTQVLRASDADRDHFGLEGEREGQGTLHEQLVFLDVVEIRGHGVAPSARVQMLRQSPW